MNMQNNPQHQQMQALKQLMYQHQVTCFQANDLMRLHEWDICFLCDDSGSMRATVNNGIQGQPKASRWDELRNTVSMVVDVARTFNAEGMDLHFLNRAPIKSVTHSTQLQPAFAASPNGYTPLQATLRRLLAENTAHYMKKPLLLIIATDGQPTNHAGANDMHGFRQAVVDAVNTRSRVVRIQFLACSDNDTDVGWLNEMDRRIKNVDVTDDYHSERNELLRAGRFQQFTRGDYVCKALLGGICDKFDQLDGQDRHGFGMSAAPPPNAAYAQMGQMGQMGRAAAPMAGAYGGPMPGMAPAPNQGQMGRGAMAPPPGAMRAPSMPYGAQAPTPQMGAQMGAYGGPMPGMAPAPMQGQMGYAAPQPGYGAPPPGPYGQYR